MDAKEKGMIQRELAEMALCEKLDQTEVFSIMNAVLEVWAKAKNQTLKDECFESLMFGCDKYKQFAQSSQQVQLKTFFASFPKDLLKGFDFSDKAPCKLLDAELITSFAPVADRLDIFRLAGKIGNFVLKNSAPELPMAIVYDTLRHVLGNLALNAANGNALWSPEACGAVIKLACLQENGLLPEFEKPEVSAFFDAVIEAGLEGSALPQCDPSYWSKLTLYLNTLLPGNSK